MITQDRAPTDIASDHGASGDDVAEFGVIGFDLPRWYPKTPFRRFVIACALGLALWAILSGAAYYIGEAMLALP